MVNIKEEDECQFPKCISVSDLVYLGKGLCEKHWKVIANMEAKDAYKKLHINREVKSGKPNPIIATSSGKVEGSDKQGEIKPAEVKSGT